MKIGIISDSHDHISNLQGVLSALGEQGVEAVLHAGDLCSPFVLPELDTLDVPIHIVFGNNDGDQFGISEMCHNELSNCTLHGELAELELGGVHIAMTHYPKVASALASSGAYDVVIFGHTHIASEQKVGECILINPGEVMGRKGRVTYAVLDTETREARILPII